ncbi:MAG: signal peptidase II [Acholeplasmataceae bacterium]|jgi:signal peptidase II|nr:signal peptidase II [Acholeplasmataceae bacterium]
MLIGFIIIVIGLMFDQLTKQLAFHYLYNEGVVKVLNPIPYILRLSYHENSGASFGIGDGYQFLFIIVTIFALAIFAYLFKDVNFKTKRTYSIAIALFIAGTLGNFVDRILFGYVIDFMQFPFLGPILNLVGLPNFYNNWADMYLSLAIVLFAIDLFFFESKRLKKEKIDHETNQD